MESKRRLLRWMCLILLFIPGNISTASRLSGVHNETDLYLNCTNDLDSMSCDFDAQNCFEYSLSIDGYGQNKCSVPKECGRGRCCCSVQMTLILGETHIATVWKRGEGIQSKNISVSESIKPKTPTITSVEEVNGNFQVKWQTNMMFSFCDSPNASVTYHKKEDIKEVSEFIQPTTTGKLKMYEISGRDLEPSTKYVVSVKSFSDCSEKFSESSEEWEFTTTASPYNPTAAIIIGLSFAAVLITGAVFVCYNIFKAKWLDTVAKSPHPKLFDLHPDEQKILRPLQTSFCSVSIDPVVLNNINPGSGVSLTDTGSESLQQSSGIDAGSSSPRPADTEPAVDVKAGVQNALGKVFAQLRPVPSVTTDLLGESNEDSGLFSTPYNPNSVRAEGSPPGCSDFENMTYSINFLSCPHQIMMDSSEVQTQAEMVCDSAYNPSEGETVSCPNQQVQACLPPTQQGINLPVLVSSLMPANMSYQQYNSGTFSYAKDSSLSSVSSATNTIGSCDLASRVEAGCESLDEVVDGPTKLNGNFEDGTICDDNPCYHCLPAGSHSFPPVDDDYQAFQNLAA
ncbi:uncharacterized protein AKAME5_001042200 [Lates japonicus]|uniref:Fibronectin type-III domain-containing protein n=1 Tax=Lates japonicus TaxID=270547 RepID=A0AAD3R7Z5_LATJO|nr:uncharacterized protein AKAME5_001042200 [Lates japonicus]